MSPRAYLAEHSNAGSNGVVHLPLLEIAAGIFPHQLDGEIAREHLAVVRVATEICIDVPPSGRKSAMTMERARNAYAATDSAQWRTVKKREPSLHPAHHAAR